MINNNSQSQENSETIQESINHRNGNRNSHLLTESVPSQEGNLDLSILISIIKHRYPPALIGFAGVILGAVLYLIFAPRMYRANALIILENRQESVSELGRDLSDFSGSNEYSPLATQSKLVESVPVIKTALENLAQEEGDWVKDISPEAIQQDLDVKVLPNTNIIEVSYVNSDPELSALILNEVVRTVIAGNTDLIRSEARSVKQFLEKEVREQRIELSQAERQESLYRQENQLVSLDNQTSNLVNRLDNLETQEQNLLTQIKEQETKVDRLKQLAKVSSAESAYIESKIGQDPQLEKLRTQLTDVEIELAAARSDFNDNHPAVVTLLEKREEIRSLYQQQVRNVLGAETTITSSRVLENSVSQTEDGIDQEVFSELITNQTQLAANRDKLEAIQNETEKIRNQISLLPTKAQSLTELVREREQANERLEFLQRKLEEARLAEAQLVSNIQIVELANTPSSPSSPKIPFVLVIASAVGITLAAGIILLLEIIDRTVYDDTTIEQQLHIPFLTALPKFPDSGESLEHIQSFLQDRTLYEPYRALLKRLDDSSLNGVKVVVVTSGMAAEGKSAVASHLGAVAAILSRRTLIIDAHLLQPRQHHWFDIELQPGLVETVTSSFNLTEAFQPTEINNLSVLPAGILTSNSCTIMESPSIKSIIREAAMCYDLVIIDAPSVSSGCDVHILKQWSDGLVMVTRPFYTNRNILEETVVELKRNRASVLGFLINNTDKQKHSFRNIAVRNDS
jgi:capsular exopolysaccharide synthesis family protein